VEAVSLPSSSSLGLKRSETHQGEPVRMAFAGHQFPWAFADALGKPAAHEAQFRQHSRHGLFDFARCGYRAAAREVG
jgi:hypothetical protein